MSENVLSGFPEAIPVRFRGYDRRLVDEELHELRTAVNIIRDERDRAVGRTLALEAQLGPLGAAAQDGGPLVARPTSATVRWLIDTAEHDADQIRKGAEEQAAQLTEQAEQLLRQRIELIEQAQHEADVCRARAAEEARSIVYEALEQANVLICGLRESEAALRDMFAGGRLNHAMPPPRQPENQEPAVLPPVEVG